MEINISSLGWDLSSADPENIEDDKCAGVWLTPQDPSQSLIIQ